jgi:hypothetical protein
MPAESALRSCDALTRGRVDDHVVARNQKAIPVPIAALID